MWGKGTEVACQRSKWKEKKSACFLTSWNCTCLFSVIYR